MSFVEDRPRSHFAIEKMIKSPTTEENGKNPGTSFSDEFVLTSRNHTDESGNVDLTVFAIGVRRCQTRTVFMFRLNFRYCSCGSIVLTYCRLNRNSEKL